MATVWKKPTRIGLLPKVLLGCLLVPTLYAIHIWRYSLPRLWEDRCEARR